MPRGHLFLLNLLRRSMVLKDILLLARIVELDLVRAFTRPVEKELGRRPADSARYRADLDVKWTRGGETECAGHIRDCAYQEPAARVELKRAQGARLLPV